MLFAKLHGVTPGDIGSWIEKGGPCWDSDKTMVNTIQHDDHVVSAPILESFPLEVLEHLGHAVSPVVISLDEAGTSSLHHVNFVNQFFCLGIPDQGSIF